MAYHHALCRIDSQYFAAGSCCDINIYKMIEPFDAILQKTLTGHEEYVYSLKKSERKEILISGSIDTSCKVWNISTGQCLKTCMSQTSMVLGIAVLFDTIFVTAAEDVRFWSLDSKDPLKIIKQPCIYVYDLAITKDMRLFSCGGDEKVRIYQL